MNNWYFFPKIYVQLLYLYYFFFAFKLLGDTNYQKDHNENIQHKFGGYDYHHKTV